MSITHIDVARIAEGLRIRQKLQAPSLLFLGARAGALFRSQNLYDELSRFSYHSLAAFDQIAKFQACVRLLEQDRFSNTDIHYTLLRLLQASYGQDTEQYLAALIRLNFFQLIVTTNIDVGLEMALSRINLHAKSDFDVFIPSVRSRSSAPPLSIRRARDSYPPFTLVKLYGELAMDRYDFKHRGKAFESGTQLYQQLRDMRNWNILMVGFDPVWDAEAVPILFPCAGKLWYVNEEIPPEDSNMFKYTQSHNTKCLLGVTGHSENFFQLLYQHLIGDIPPTVPEEHPPRKSKPPLTTKHQVDVLILATTERERTALLKEHYGDTSEHTMQGKTYYDLGKVGDASVFLMQVDEMDPTLGAQIQALSPSWIIILGIAWSFNYKGQDIGNLLIPDRILMYKHSTPVTGSDAMVQAQREQRVIPAELLNLFKNGSIILKKKTKGLVRVTFGMFFSSTEAIDQQTAFSYVSNILPDAIGIEPSNTALFSLAQSYQENCLLIKVVSTLVDIDEPINQDMPEGSLENAAQFILDIIALGGFHDPSPPK